MDPDAAAEYMVQQIFARAFPPGSRVTERDIAEACACTHAFARNVIHRLQILGAVRFSSRRGAAVLGPADFREEEVTRVWSVMLPLLERKAKRPYAEPGAARSGYARRLAVRAELDRLGRKAGDPRLTELLQRIALQRLILQEVPG